MTLRDLRLIFQRHVFVAFAVFALSIAGGFAGAFMPAPTYSTSAAVVIGFRGGDGVGNLGGGSVQQAVFLLPALEQTATSRGLKLRAAEFVPEDLRRIRVDISAATDASVLRVKGVSTSPEAAQAYVNAVIDRLIAEQSEEGPILLSALDPAPLKARPISPNVPVTIGASIVFGTIAALLSTLLVDRLRSAFDSRQAIREGLDTTVLGELPKIRGLRRGRQTIGEALESVRMREAFDEIRANLDFKLADTGSRAIAIVSYSKGSGKTTVAGGLALVRSRLGWDTCVIDADLRRPSLASQLGARSAPGLAEYANSLAGDPMGELLADNLGVIPAGITSEPVDVLKKALPSVVDKVVDEQYFVIVDSPPFAGAPESSFIVANVQHVVLVVNDDSTDLGDLPRAIDHINGAGGQVLGVVLNRVPSRRLRHRYYGSRQPRRRLFRRNNRSEPTIVDTGTDREPSLAGSGR